MQATLTGVGGIGGGDTLKKQKASANFVILEILKSCSKRYKDPVLWVTGLDFFL